jgi:ParB family transcriptional regulator, chromosome partitioning protein
MKKVAVKDRANMPLVPLQLSDADVEKINPLDKPATGPGTMMKFMREDSATFIENEQLKAQLDTYKGSNLTRRLDSASVVRSKWANRHEQSFADKEFLKLKAEIDGAGGNVQPIKVRPLAGEKDKFEVVFGHRRHQACLELGLPVLAMIEDLSEQDLFAQMDRENRDRKDLRPYEQGLMYAKALDEGLFPSAKKMSASLGVAVQNIGTALTLARLPSEVVAAFPSPLDLQFRWASELKGALERNPDFVISEANKICSEAKKPSSREVLGRLTKGGNTVLPPVEKIKGSSGEVGVFAVDAAAQSASWNFKSITPSMAKKVNEAIINVLKAG